MFNYNLHKKYFYGAKNFLERRQVGWDLICVVIVF